MKRPNKREIYGPAFVPWGTRRDTGGWVVDPNGCHIWVGARDSSGYGTLRKNGITYSVHKLRYQIEVAQVPAGMVLDHYFCNNGPGGCCNPLHLGPVTHRENVLRDNDGTAALNATKACCPKGHAYAGDNLTVWGKESRPSRRCRACEKARSRRRRETTAADQGKTLRKWNRQYAD